MSTFPERLRIAMERAGVTQSQLARAVGVKPQSIQHLCGPSSRASGSEFTATMGHVLGVSARWLESGTGDMDSPLSEYMGAVACPVLTWEQAAAFAETRVRPESERHLFCPVPISAQSFATVMPGASMAPKIQAGDLLFVDCQAKPRSGDTVLANRAGSGLTVKELTIEDDAAGLIAVNPGWPHPMSILRSMKEIFGVVVWRGSPLR